MASFKLAEGIRLFNKDMMKLKDLIHGSIINIAKTLAKNIK